VRKYTTEKEDTVMSEQASEIKRLQKELAKVTADRDEYKARWEIVLQIYRKPESQYTTSNDFSPGVYVVGMNDVGQPVGGVVADTGIYGGCMAGEKFIRLEDGNVYPSKRFRQVPRQMPEETLMTVRQVAEALGVSDSVVRHMVITGDLRAEARANGSTRIPSSSVSKVMRTQQKEAR
jgi:excisionase family DNA binding protein